MLLLSFTFCRYVHFIFTCSIDQSVYFSMFFTAVPIAQRAAIRTSSSKSPLLTIASVVTFWLTAEDSLLISKLINRGQPF